MKELTLPINSIYRATEGEGIHVGTPQVFIRTQGCSIGCLNCDSKDTWEFTQESHQKIDSILNEVGELSLRGKIGRVSITGGDPLHPKNQEALLALIKELKSRRYYINLEAAGTRVIHEVFDCIDYISFDAKTPSTGVATPISNIEELIVNYPSKAQIKSVIETRKDFDYIFGLKEKIDENLDAKKLNLENPWVLTPAYNLEEEFPQERFQNIIDWNEKAGAPFRVIGQQHKWIHGPDKKHI